MASASPISLNTTTSAFAAAYANHLQAKRNRTTQGTAMAVTRAIAQWGDLVDDFMIAAQASLRLVYTGTGSPNGTVTAPVGSLYLRTDGAAGSTLYVKETGTGNTGWTALGSSSGLVRSIANIDDDLDVVNTTTPTSILAVEVPANLVSDGQSVRVSLFGDHFNQTAANRFWTIQIRLGGVTLYQAATQSYTSSTARRPWTLDFEIMRKTATTAALAGRYASLTSASQPTTGLGLIDATGNTGGPIRSAVTHPTVNWAIDQDVEVIVTPSDVGANCSFALRGGRVEIAG